MEQKKEIDNKGFSALVLFLLSMGGYALYYLLGGILGDLFGTAGLVLLVWSIIKFFQEQYHKIKSKKAAKNK